MIIRSVCALTAVLLLAACGGGGMLEPPTPGTAYSTDQDRFIAANIAAATARPAFGSGVTQSSNKNGAGVSTASAQSSFDGDTYTLRIARRNGSTLLLNSNDHREDVGAATSIVTDREMTVERLLDYDARSVTAASGAVEFDPGYGGWMSRGYWVHLTGNWAEGEASDIEVGVYVDGPEFSSSASVPVIGSATYEGVASGLVSVKAGAGSRGILRETGRYYGDFRLTADFSSGLVSGAIHSDAITTFFSFGDGTSGWDSREIDSRIDLGPTSINSDGSFSGSDVTLTTAFVPNPLPSEGYWGGRFSTIDDSAGAPRAVAGTHGATMSLPGGASITYVGYHFGATDDF